MTNEQKVDSKNTKKIHNAKLHMNCFSSAAMAINNLHGHGQLLDSPTVMQDLIDSASKVNNGDMREIVQMLMTQAKVLDYILYDAITKLADLDMVNQIEAIVNIALRAQSQSRKTLAALAEIKHPKRAAFIKTQNNAVQVNQLNLKRPKNSANELKARVIYEKKSMDIGATIATDSENTTAEAVAVLQRS